MSDVARLRSCLAAAFACGIALASPSAVHGQDHPGKPVYDRWCAECHGVDGRGDGPAAAWMLPRPRDFTQARYQIRTTPSGAVPTDADLMKIIEQGMPGTAMPGWPKLSRRDRQQLVDYLKTFSRFFEDVPQPVTQGRAPRVSDEVLEEGRRLYDEVECWKCHGQAGRGDGPSAPTQRDDNDWPIRPADLTQNWLFNGGGRVEDIHMRLLTGINGTPMPSFGDLIEAGMITESQLWSIAHYVRSLSPERPPVPREVIRAVLRSGDLPSTPGDAAWDDIPSFYVPLVGQIIEPPRWFAPTVQAVWIQAVHDGSELVLRLSWNDPSRSPDPVWEEWRERVVAVMEPHDEPPAGGPLNDAFAVQFAPAAATRDLPYFLMGDGRSPVHLWHWTSAGTVAEMTARGLDRLERLQSAPDVVRGAAAWEEGQWRLVLRRSLVPAEPDEARPSFTTGEPFPIAFFAWDGSNGEAGKRGSIGSWYFLFLEQPATARVWIVPLLTALFTALLGIVVVRQAQTARPRETAAPIADVAIAEP